MDPIETITPYKDSTLAMLLEAERRNYTIFYMNPGDLYVQDGETFALCHPLKVMDDNEQWFEKGEGTTIALADLNIILMRQDPPFTMDYIYTTYLVEKAERHGTIVVNKPQSVRDCNEKLFATQFPQCCTPTLVSQNSTLLREFVNTHQDTIFKPLDGMGGSNIFRVRADSHNISVVIEVLTNHGHTQIMAQRYIPEITEGDKRILMIDGEPLPYALARIPQEGETRGNLAAGGHGEGRKLSDRDRWLAEQIGPTLKEKGLIFVGLDVIGDYVTEINVTSPTCIRELDKLYDLNIAGQLMDCLEAKLTN